MKFSASKIKDNIVVKTALKIICHKLFPFFSAAMALLCYYLNWDLPMMYYIAIIGSIILIFSDDVTPLIHILLFMVILVSYKNAPSFSETRPDYYYNTANLVQIFLILALFISSALGRIISTAVKKRFKLTPMFFGLCALAAVLLINGLFSKEYVVKDLLYGLILAASFLGVYSAMKDNMKLDEGGYEKIAFAFFAFSLVLLTELIVKYATTENLFVNGEINRYLLTFGWGSYNTWGVFMVMSMPSVFYLAWKKNYGFLYTLYSILMLIATFLSCSRQSMFGVVIVYPFCLIMLLFKGGKRLANICVVSAMLISVCTLMIVFRKEVSTFFEVVFSNVVVDGEFSGSGRMKIYKEALQKFFGSPIFGAGFYVQFSYTTGSGLSFIPHLAHNTVLQMMSSCGMVGLGVYAVHRYHTVKSFLSNINSERMTIALTILALLIICLLDNHIFNIFPTIIYSALVAALEHGDKQKEKQALPVAAAV